mgnify:CR=1 FL=1|tara:strand:+ start:1074 stop:2099 length:1026 start_codon:yes stop_codon:yes gene_type:complete
MNIKLSLLTTIIVGILFPVVSVQASSQVDVDVLIEDYFVVEHRVSEPYTAVDVCLDIINDAQIKISTKTVLQEQVILKEIPDNIDRLTFNALGVSGTDFMDYGGLRWSRVEEEGSNKFSENLPDARCVYSNTTKGLCLEGIEEGDDDFIVTYSYAASILAPKSSYEFSVRTSLDSYGALQREIQDLKRRRTQVLSNPSLDLIIEKLEEKLFRAAKDGEGEQKSAARALVLLDVARDQFSIARKKLQNFYDDREDSAVSYKHYACFAWNVYQFRNLIQKGLEDFTAQLDEGKGSGKLSETLDVYERNVALHYDTNIVLFSKWASGEEITSGMGGLFSRFLEG